MMHTDSKAHTVHLGLLEANKVQLIAVYSLSGYYRYSFGIGIGRYIGFADKENVLSLSVSLSADKKIVFIGLYRYRPI